MLVDAAGPQITRLLLCSGKFAYDLAAERDRRSAVEVAIVRLEELYPLPVVELRAVFARWPDATATWVQEEPRNMGAFAWLDRRIEALRGAPMAYIGRPEAGSPAGSFHGDHDADQQLIVATAFA